tara:strand:- start:230 stop:568 length:339 start_codon:yes stop_codon:yes gene_type:complete
MKIYFKGKSKDIRVKPMGVFQRFIGLMFKSKNCGNLLFEFSSTARWKIHSFFVFFDFLAVWLDESNNVIEIRRVKPFTTGVTCKRGFKRLVEIPINVKNREIIGFLVGEKFI